MFWSCLRLSLVLFCCAYLAACGQSEQELSQAKAELSPRLRIVTLAPHLAELVFSAGAGANLVGVVNYTDYPPEAAEIPRVGDAFRVDYEKIVELDPDFVLTWRKGTPAEVINYLRQLGFDVRVLESGKLSDIAQQIEQLGELAGTADIARLRAANLRAELKLLQPAAARKVTVFLQIAANPWYTVTAEHILNDAIEFCGGENVFAQLNGVAPTVSLEAIIDANPAVILVVRATPEQEWRSAWQAWPQVDAVARDQVYPLDADFVSRAGPRMITGVGQICAALDDARAQVY
jgi:iron complex transport system substrate-binding protein